ncbi:L-lactate dehydrogenase [Rubeoparvulum massiliense]|uniref:L-lactate dehydrogenase n=1 Tax=Rubeoparvulum massiliense TaxID=1631346 RepID=UPI00065E9B54|nr:L-lactate dehydrogenase [Rubeoparvulum massiliense]
MKQSSKIVLIGCGAVGSTFAYTLLVKGLVNELVIIDANHDKAVGDVLDLNHGLLLAQPMKITAGDYSDCRGADIIVISAGSAQRPGETRIDLLKRNVAIFRQIIDQITQYNRDAILLIATNPVDILTYVTYRLSGFPESRVIGSGTLLDSSRFRYLVAEQLQIDPRNVHGLVIGEHGDSEVAVWSSVNLPGLSLHAFEDDPRWAISTAERKRIEDETRNAAYHIIEKKGATYYAIALALVKICEAILKDQHSIIPVSAYLHDYHGVSDLYLGVPAIVGLHGIEEVVPMNLLPEEKAQFLQSAEKLHSLIEQLGI